MSVPKGGNPTGEAAIGTDLHVIRQTPFNAETPSVALAAPVTSTPHVYVRTNFDIPELDSRTHKVDVSGAVATPFSFTLADLAGFEQATLLSTMECAGNDRAAMEPPATGEPWTGGAVSTVRWSGVPLQRILDDAVLEKSAVEVLFEGADRGQVDSVASPVNFARALPLSKALHPETLLATSMNGEPLPPRYGAPVRLVVPGWFGMASVKWLRRIEVLTAPYAGHFQTRRYVYHDGQSATPVTHMRVKSLIVDPTPGAVIAIGRTRIWGWAWSGEGPITAVDVSEGNQSVWHPARLEPPMSTSAWTRWEIELDLQGPGTCVLRSRARDAAGNVQPERVQWNALGYGNNAIRAMTLRLVSTTAP